MATPPGRIRIRGGRRAEPRRGLRRRVTPGATAIISGTTAASFTGTTLATIAGGAQRDQRAGQPEHLVGADAARQRRSRSSTSTS